MRRAGPWLLVGIVAIALYFALHRSPEKKESPSTPELRAPTSAPPAALSHDAANRRNTPASIATSSTVVVRGKWGSALGEFGRRHDAESNPEAPMAVVAHGGDLFVLDQVNHRVQQFRDGKAIAAVNLGGETAQDIALGKNGRLAVLDRLGDRNVQLYDASGKLENEIPLVGKGIAEGGAVTGVFFDDDGIYVEREHRALVRIADESGHSDSARDELAGRPSRDGAFLLSAAIADRAAGRVTVRAIDRRQGTPVWSSDVQLPASPLHLLLLDSDRQGRVYVGAEVGNELAAPPFRVDNARIVVVRLTADGAPSGSVEIPLSPSPDETFRPLSIDDNGTIYAESVSDELTITRYTIP